MKIEFKEESNKLIITKTSFEELSKLKKKMKWGFLFLNCFSIYFFINLYLKGAFLYNKKIVTKKDTSM